MNAALISYSVSDWARTGRSQAALATAPKNSSRLATRRPRIRGAAALAIASRAQADAVMAGALWRGFIAATKMRLSECVSQLDSEVATGLRNGIEPEIGEG